MNVPGSSYDFCVLIPCYNNLSGLIQSLKSIRYTGPFCVVVVDDGSDRHITEKDLGKDFFEQFFLTIVRLEQNKGITHALNAGLERIISQIDTRYIARLDCGDICSENRFTQQVDFFRAHPEVGLLGSWCTFEDHTSYLKYKYITPTEHEKICKEMCFRNVFIHPTVMFRAELLEKIGLYPYEYPYAEDYAFFWSILKISKGAILSGFFVNCEINTEGISLKNRGKQLISRQKIVATFAQNKILKTVGLLKLKLLRLLPFQMVSKLKKIYAPWLRQRFCDIACQWITHP